MKKEVDYELAEMLEILKENDKKIFNDTANILKTKIKKNRKAIEASFRIKLNNNKIKRFKYFIKESKYDYKTNELIYEILNEMKEKGFKNLPIENVTLKNNKVFCISNNIKCKKYNAVRVDFTNEVDIIETMKLIKRFHSIYLSNEFYNRLKNKNLLESFNSRNYYGTWYDIYKRKKEEIIEFKNIITREISKTNILNFDKEYMNYINISLLECEKAEQLLKESKYRNKSIFDFKCFGICHHDLEFHNVLKIFNGKKNKFYLIDFEYLIIDIWHHDFASVVKRVLRSNRLLEDKEILRDDTLKISMINKLVKLMVKTYRIKDKDDIKIIKSLILFPEEFWQIGYQKYIENQNWDIDRFNRKLKKAIISQNNKNYILEALDDVFN